MYSSRNSSKVYLKKASSGNFFKDCFRNSSKNSFTNSSKNSFRHCSIHSFGIPPRIIFEKCSLMDSFENFSKEFIGNFSKYFFKNFVSKITAVIPSSYPPETLQRLLSRTLTRTLCESVVNNWFEGQRLLLQIPSGITLKTHSGIPFTFLSKIHSWIPSWEFMQEYAVDFPTKMSTT